MTGRTRRPRVAGFFSMGITHLEGLRKLLDVDEFVLRPTDEDACRLAHVIGWGHKANVGRVREYAGRHQLPFLRLEDGFFRSVELPAEHERPLSAVVDEQGIYYDATAVSDLESMLQGEHAESRHLQTLRARARACIDTVVRNRLSKYNHAPEKSLGRSKRSRVLVVDQTYGDMSVKLGLVPEHGFSDMLRAALNEHPDAEVIIKTHPEVVAGRKRGYLDGDLAHRRVRVLSELMNPISMLEQVDHVYVATSQLGFEALLVGKPVTCFGVPFYAGWGLTDDRVAVPRRTEKRSVEELFAAAAILYPRYIDPHRNERCELEEALEHLALQRAMHQRHRGTMVCVGFEFTDKRDTRALLYAPDNQVVFARTPRKLMRTLDSFEDARIVVKGARTSPALEAFAAENDVSLWSATSPFDGFELLGEAFERGHCLALEPHRAASGRSQPTELEQILNQAEFSPDLLERAEALVSRIVRGHAVNSNAASLPQLERLAREGKRIALVLGHCAEDLDPETCGDHVRTNLELLAAVRAQRPDHVVVFRPHPRALAVESESAVSYEQATKYANYVIARAPLTACFDLVTEVHTMASGSGFEALLFGLPVHVYGRPFYAGWGLTSDRYAMKHRKRTLSVSELAAGTLILHPTYTHPHTRQFCQPEQLLSMRPLPRQLDATHLDGPIFARYARRVGVALREIIRSR